jgi:hypothetical protein
VEVVKSKNQRLPRGSIDSDAQFHKMLTPSDSIDLLKNRSACRSCATSTSSEALDARLSWEILRLSTFAAHRKFAGLAICLSETLGYAVGVSSRMAPRVVK